MPGVLQQNVPKIYDHQDDHPCTTTTVVTSLDNQLEIKFKLAQYCFLLHSGLHQAKLKIVPHVALELVETVRPVYKVKFNLREPPAFNDALHPGKGLPTITYTP